MKLSELKTRLKNKYVVRIVAGVLTIALLGSSMTAVAVQADQKKDAAVQTEQKEDSSDKKDDIEDLLQVSVSDKEIGKDDMKGVPTGRGRLSLFPNMEGSNLSPNFSIIVRRSFLPTKSSNNL